MRYISIWIRLLSGVIVTLMAVSASPAESLAQRDAIVGSPDQCTVKPRPDAFFARFPATVEPVLPSPEATPASTSPPATPPSGEPADAETEEEVVQLLELLSACENAGDPQRVLALYTDDTAAQIVAFVGSETFLEGREERSEALWTGYELIETMTLDDGKVGAVVETVGGRYSSMPEIRQFVTFEQTDDGLRVDRSLVLDFIEATPEPVN